ncbi:addiction module protein [Nannocystaceae bacterium ST9]
MSLPLDARAELAVALADSLARDPSERAVMTAWLDEARRRLQGLRAGEDEGIPFDELDREVRAKIERAKLRTSAAR